MSAADKKLIAGIDAATGCAVLYDKEGDIKLMVPNGKMRVERLGTECEACNSADLAFAEQIAAAIAAGRADSQPAEMLEILEECRSSVVFDRTRYSQLVLSGSTHAIKTVAADECGRLGVLLDRMDAIATRAEKGGT